MVIAGDYKPLMHQDPRNHRRSIFGKCDRRIRNATQYVESFMLKNKFLWYVMPMYTCIGCNSSTCDLWRPVVGQFWKAMFYIGFTHWGRMTQKCVSKLTFFGSDNGLWRGRHQAVIWTHTGTLLIGSLGTNFSEILIRIYIFPFNKMHLKTASAKWRPFCLGLNEYVF